MANLKRNMIELVKSVEEDKVITDKYWTPLFLPMSVTYEAIDLSEELQNGKIKERDMMDRMIDFVANKIYKGLFTREQLIDGLHAPDAIQILQEQILFIAQGQQTNETKEYLAKKG